MTFGALTLNDAGRVQIDGELPNYYVMQSGFAASGQSVARPAPSQIIFVRPHTTPGTIYLKSPSSQTVFSVISSTGYFEYVFVKAFGADYTGGSNGLKVFSEAGALCFDSNAPQLNFAASAEVSLSLGVETVIDIPNPSGKKVYVNWSASDVCVFRLWGGRGYVYAPVQTFDSEVRVRSKVTELPNAGPLINLGPFSATRSALFLYKQE